jgi:hypothetical protein
MMNRLEVLSQVDREAWNAEVVRLKGGPFHTYEWSRFSSESNHTRPLFVKWHKDNDETAAMGLGQLERKAIAGYSIMTCFSMGSFPASTERECINESIDGLMDYCQKNGIWSLRMHSFGTPIGTEVLQQYGFKVERRWEFLVAMDGSEDDLWKRLHSKKRNLIRKGQKAGLRVNRAFEPKDLLQFRALAVETQRRKADEGISFPRPPGDRYYRLLKERLMDTGLGRLYMAFDGDRPVGGAFFAGFNGSAYYMLSSAIETGLRKAAPDLILWSAMTDYMREGFRLFNLGGLSEGELKNCPLEESGLYHFKQRFSAEAYPCFKGTFIFRPKELKVYSFLKSLKFRLSNIW